MTAQQRTKPKAQQRPVPPAEAVALVRHRNEWQRDISHKALTIAIVSMLVAGAAIGTVVAAFSLQPKPVYIAVDDEGRMTPIIPVSQPIRTPSEVAAWTMRAVSKTLSIDFLHYQDQLAEAEMLFTREGFSSYLNALKGSGNLDSIKQNKYVVQVTPRGTPRITGQGELNGRYSYRIEIPLMVDYQSGTSRQHQKVNATLLVVRVSTARSRDGLAIQQFVQKGN